MAATMTFEYSVRDKAGKLVAGTLEADTPGGGRRRKLKRMGYAPVSISAGQRRA